jgi:hypothetical protein
MINTVVTSTARRLQINMADVGGDGGKKESGQ